MNRFFKAEDKVLSILSILSIVSLLMPKFINFKKMRIKTSVKLSAYTCFGFRFWVILSLVVTILAICLLFKKSDKKYFIISMLSTVSIMYLFYSVSNSLDSLPLEKTKFSRLTFGQSMWFWLFIQYGIFIKANSSIKNKKYVKLLIIIPFIIAAALLLTNRLDGLGIVMEYKLKKKRFWTELFKHIKISMYVVITAIIIGIPIGYLSNKFKVFDRVVFGILNFTETIPALSFIAIIMIPLYYLSDKYDFIKNLGISGFGLAPAFVALLFYALFPIVHSTRAAFKSVDPNYIEVSKAMGLNDFKSFFKIEVPLALPLILSGIKLAILFSISGTSLAAYTGAGGLGVFLFEREFMDLILLGILPIVFITFVLDNLVDLLIKRVEFN